MVAAQTPTLAKIKNSASETDARALLYIAVCELCDFFNVGKNMSDTQIALTVDLILESYWHLKLEEIKFCFRRAMRREKLFDRLDGNIILSWLREYNDERTEEAMRQSDQEAQQRINSVSADPDAITHEQYVEQLRQRAANGEQFAIDTLKEIDGSPPLRHKPLTAEERHAKEVEFKQWYYKYLAQKRNEK